jgi:hypothetical protein
MSGLWAGYTGFSGGGGLFGGGGSAPPPPSFTGRGVLFESGDYLRNGTISRAGSTQLTVSLWFRHTGPTWNSSSGGRLVDSVVGVSDAQFSIRTASLGRLTFVLPNTANTGAARTSPTSPAFAVDQWYHLAISIDIALQRFQVYINRVEMTAGAYSWPTPGTPFRLESTMTAMGVAVNAVGGVIGFPGDLAHVWWDFGTSLDFATPANLDKFVTVGGEPVDLGVRGELPTGSEPDFYFDGTAATFNNTVTGGPSFTLTGSLTTSSSPPEF